MLLHAQAVVNTLICKCFKVKFYFELIPKDLGKLKRGFQELKCLKS